MPVFSGPWKQGTYPPFHFFIFKFLFCDMKATQVQAKSWSLWGHQI